MYFKALNINGTQYPIAVNITGPEPPHSKTEALPGMLYMNTSNGYLYKCIAASGGSYTWSYVSEAPDTTIWRTALDLSGTSGTEAESILTRIAGRTPKANDYIVDSANNLLRISSRTGTSIIVEKALSGGTGGTGGTTTDTGVTIWQTTSDLSEIGPAISPQQSASILTPINGKSPKANDYIIDSVGNFVKIMGIVAESGDIYVANTSIVPCSGGSGGSDKTIWTSTGNFGSGTPMCYRSTLNTIEGKTPTVDDYVIDAGANLLRIWQAVEGIDYVSVELIYKNTASQPNTTIWRTTQDLTGAYNSANPVHSLDILEQIEGRTPKANDYVLDGVGNLIKILGVSTDTFTGEDVSNYNARMTDIEDRLDVAEKGLEAIDDIDTALDGIIAIQENLIGTIEFELECEDNASNRQYEVFRALRGMTWGEWIGSRYDESGGQVYIDAEGAVSFANGDMMIYDADGSYQYSHTVIEHIGSYSHD